MKRKHRLKWQMITAIISVSFVSVTLTVFTVYNISRKNIQQQYVKMAEDNLRAFQAAMEEQRENERADWGLTLTVSGVTPTGLTLTFTQSGGQPTGELEYGSRYWLERKDGEGWTRRSDILEPSVNLAWTDEAYMIPMNDQTSWEVDWSWLYGRLSPGRYRIGKEVTDFRKTGDYDTQNYYAEFEVK